MAASWKLATCLVCFFAGLISLGNSTSDPMVPLCDAMCWEEQALAAECVSSLSCDDTTDDDYINCRRPCWRPVSSCWRSCRQWYPRALEMCIALRATSRPAPPSPPPPSPPAPPSWFTKRSPPSPASTLSETSPPTFFSSEISPPSPSSESSPPSLPTSLSSEASPPLSFASSTSSAPPSSPFVSASAPAPPAHFALRRQTAHGPPAPFRLSSGVEAGPPAPFGLSSGLSAGPPGLQEECFYRPGQLGPPICGGRVASLHNCMIDIMLTRKARKESLGRQNMLLENLYP